MNLQTLASAALMTLLAAPLLGLSQCPGGGSITPTPSPPTPTPRPGGGDPADPGPVEPDPRCQLAEDGSGEIDLSPEVCGGGEARPAGPLCGDGAHPCQLTHLDPVTAADPVALYYGLNLALSGDGDPTILAFSNTTPRIFARRTSGAWISDDFIKGSNHGALAPAPGGGVYFLETHPHGTLWHRSAAGQWQCVGPGAYVEYVDGVALRQDASGCMYASAAQNQPSARFLAARDTAWSVDLLEPGQGDVVNGTVALSPAGAPHFLGMVNRQTSTLSWRGPGGEIEELIDSEYSSGSGHLTVTAGPDADLPWAIYMRHVPEYLRARQVSVAERVGPNRWRQRVVAQDTTDSQARCDYTPVEGDVCDLDYFTYGEGGITSAADGSVRALYVESRITGELIASCPAGKVSSAAQATPINTDCSWAGETRVRSWLHVVDPSADAFVDARVGGLEFNGSLMDADVKAAEDGSIHLALSLFRAAEGPELFHIQLD